MFKQVLVACGLLTGLSAAAWAGPMIGLDDPTCSSFIGVSTTSSAISLDVNGSGGGVFCLYNAMQGLVSDGPDGGAQPITELTLQTTATITNLGDGEGQNNAGNNFGIGCTSVFFNTGTNLDEGNSPGTCKVTYDGSLLTIDFSAPVSNLDGDEGPTGNDTEAGQDEGIPQLPTGCSAPFSSDACTGQGLFFINLNDGDSYSSEATGQWNTIGVTSLDITAVNGTTLPEPSSVVLFGMSLLLIGGFVRRQTARDRG